MYQVGQVVNIGYYGGFRNQTLVKTQAEITMVDERVAGTWIKAKVMRSPGVYKTMFGCASDLRQLEENYTK